MNSKTYILIAHHRDSLKVETQDYTDEDIALEALRAFDDPENAKKYSFVELVEFDWEKRSEYRLDGISFEI